MGLGCARTVQRAFCVPRYTNPARLIAIEVAIHGSLANPEHLADFVVQSAATLWTCRSLVLPPAIPFRQFSGHSITIGSTVTEGRQSARPALPFLLWGVLPMALFGSSQCLGGVIRSRSPDSVLHPTASCKALSRHLTQGQRLAPLAS